MSPAILLTILSLCLVFVWTSAERVKYTNYRVYTVTPKSQDQLDLLVKLDAASDSVNFLNGFGAVGTTIHAIVAPHKNPEFVQALNRRSIEHELVEENLQTQLEDESEVKPRSIKDYDWTVYHTLDTTYNWLESLVQKYPRKVEIIIGGRSYEGRDIKGVKVSFKQGNKGIFLEGGIHAREWISPATVTYILNQLLTSTDPQVRELAENYDWYVFPHTNPDGYVYTQTTNRLWRMTVAPINDHCIGTDPNRNWDFHWNEVGTGPACTESYAGNKAFSEIETRTLSEYIKSLKGKIHTYLSFHSFSQILLFPYGHTKQHVPNYNDLQQIGNAAAKALARRYGTTYKVGNIYEVIYPAAGGSIDWVYAITDVPVNFAYELRPKGSWNKGSDLAGILGFILPAQQIIPTGEETLDSVVALVQESKKLGYL